ncbi:MAG: hypothetical protein HXX81_00225 [Campylobacterales bacterium]|nr:hypothetical protein [Campylobacterales bacterium]
MRDKYYATNDIKFAYSLMRAYYNQKDYQKSMFWTMKINEAEPDNEESWLFFAKNSAKLGKKDDAINALNQYIEAFKSTKAKELLDEIQKGKFD